jgi:hypothetical protein
MRIPSRHGAGKGAGTRVARECQTDIPLSFIGTAPRLLFALALMAAAGAMGSAVGDSYDKVIADDGQPANRLEAGVVRILEYPNFTIKLRNAVVVSITPTSPSKGGSGGAPLPSGPALRPYSDEEVAAMPAADQAAALQALIKRAVDRVIAIVNQPVPKVPLTPALNAGVWPQGWFHPGAITPNFDTVDVRKTQDAAQYSKYPYITSNLNPSVAFPGNEVEFNPMTKLFYQDRTLPKKRLSEREMVEINSLYRVIGKSKAQLAAMGKGAPAHQ